MKKINVISVDLDGTLLDDDRLLSVRNRKALLGATGKGIQVVVSTGSPYWLIPFELLKGIPIDYAITANGSAVYDMRTGRCIYEQTIPYELVIEINDLLHCKNIHADFFIDGCGYTTKKSRELISHLEVSPSRKKYLSQNRHWIEDIEDVLTKESKQIQKITLNFMRDTNGELVDYEEMRSWLLQRPELYITTGVKNNLEITRAGVSKAVACEWLIQKLDLRMSAVVAFGDSLNDKEILEKVGLGVAMENAMPEVKQYASMVTATNNEDGVAIWIEDHIGI